MVAKRPAVETDDVSAGGVLRFLTDPGGIKGFNGVAAGFTQCFALLIGERVERIHAQFRFACQKNDVVGSGDKERGVLFRPALFHIV